MEVFGECRWARVQSGDPRFVAVFVTRVKLGFDVKLKVLGKIKSKKVRVSFQQL